MTTPAPMGRMSWIAAVSAGGVVGSARLVSSGLNLREQLVSAGAQDLLYGGAANRPGTFEGLSIGGTMYTEGFLIRATR